MPNKKEEFYAQIRQETESKVIVYKDFQEQIDRLNKATKQSLESLKTDMKFVAKQIEANNQMLNLQGLEPVKFDK